MTAKKTERNDFADNSTEPEEALYKQTENALMESEEKYRLTFNTSPDSVNINRLEDGLCVDINDGFTKLTGFTREDVIGRTSLEINIWDDPAAYHLHHTGHHRAQEDGRGAFKGRQT